MLGWLSWDNNQNLPLIIVISSVLPFGEASINCALFNWEFQSKDTSRYLECFLNSIFQPIEGSFFVNASIERWLILFSSRLIPSDNSPLQESYSKPIQY